jgi:hypothetical protein
MAAEYSVDTTRHDYPTDTVNGGTALTVGVICCVLSFGLGALGGIIAGHENAKQEFTKELEVANRTLSRLRNDWLELKAKEAYLESLPGVGYRPHWQQEKADAEERLRFKKFLEEQKGK